MKYTIKVKAIHIKKALIRDIYNCPIALAALDTPKVKKAMVGGTIMYINNNQFSLPSSARIFIRSFDNRLKVKPFKFEVAYEQ